MIKLLKPLEYSEKSPSLRIRESWLASQVEDFKKDLGDVCNTQNRADLRAGITVLLLPLDLINVGLRTVRYCLYYPADYISAIRNRLSH